jgi:hypothetical protein
LPNEKSSANHSARIHPRAELGPTATPSSNS